MIAPPTAQQSPVTTQLLADKGFTAGPALLIQGTRLDSEMGPAFSFGVDRGQFFGTLKRVTTFIYALCEPGTRTVRYIGKSNSPKNRFRDHLRLSIKAENHLGNWLRSLSSLGEKPNLVILREVPDDYWEIAEERYIRLARGLGMKLVNGTDGGEGCHNPSAETRAKISAFLSGKPRSPETRAKISKGRLGAIMSPMPLGVREKIAFSKRGKPRSLETRAAISEGNLGKRRSPEICANISAARRKVPGKKRGPYRKKAAQV